MISILLPSRGRPTSLIRYFNLLQEHVSNPKNVEVIIRIDEDDPKLKEYKELKIGMPHQMIIGQSGRTLGLGRMFAECLALAKGNIIMLCGDDMAFGSKGFDLVVEETMPKDGIGLVYGWDGYANEECATHPFIGRRAVEIWGHISPPEFYAESLDVHIFNIFEKLNALGYNRIFYRSELITEHLHVNAGSGKAPIDDTHRNKPMTDEDGRAVYRMLEGQRKRNARQMKRYIERGGKQ